MTMAIIEIDGHSNFVRGILQRKLLEVREGLFVGSISARVRTDLWAFIASERTLTASAILIYANNKKEAGFQVMTLGPNRREPIDFDGVYLVNYTKHFSALDSSKARL